MIYCKSINIALALHVAIVASLIGTSLGQCRVICDCKNESAPSINITEIKERLKEDSRGPKLYQHVPTLTWQSSKEFCAQMGRNLCSQDQICPMKNGDRMPLRDVIPGDHWVPVINDANEWIQIGHYPAIPCTLHNAIWGAPTWGTSTVSLGHKGKVYCCEPDVTEYPSDDPSADIRYQFIGLTATYARSVAHCEKQGRRLCNSAEVCQSQTPVFGTIQGQYDKVVPVGDNFNQWINIDHPTQRRCKTLTSPTWGTRTNGSKRGEVGYVYCCKKTA